MPAHPPLVLAGIDQEALIFMLGLGFLALLVFLIHSVRKVLETRAREQTKREIAAYVAEGSIAPQDASKMINAGSDAAEKAIADAVAWGTIKPEKAEGLLRTLRSDGAKA